MNPTQLADLVEVTPAVTLRGAALYLRRHGWHQGDMFDLSVPEVAFPPACGLGGIRIALVGSAEIGADSWPAEVVADFDRAVMVFADHLFACYGQPDPTAVSVAGMSWPEQIVADWNDDYSRNVSQVIAALLGAADQWDRLHGDDKAAWMAEGTRLTPSCCGRPMVEQDGSPIVLPPDGYGGWSVARVFACPVDGRGHSRDIGEYATEAEAEAVAATRRMGGAA